MLAPMSGVTDIAMRRIARRFGASLVVTEMVAADAYARGDAANRLKAEGAGVSPHMVQIAGCEPDSMAEAARIAEDSGAAIIDINMGCPAKKVTAGYAGSHLMRNLPLAVDLIRATVRAVRIPVTLKMRLGWDAGSINAPELGRLAESEGIAMLSGAWPHPLPVLRRARRTGARSARSRPRSPFRSSPTAIAPASPTSIRCWRRLARTPS